MKNPYEELGISIHSTAEEIHNAYIQKVKQWHPDMFRDVSQQNYAQDMLCKLNLAYRNAMDNIKSNEEITYKNIRDHIKKLYKLKQYESALLYLNKDKYKDAEWYYLYGCIQIENSRYEEAHNYFRMAINIEPDNKIYRQSALNAIVKLRKSQSILGKLTNIFKKNN